MNLSNTNKNSSSITSPKILTSRLELKHLLKIFLSFTQQLSYDFYTITYGKLELPNKTYLPETENIILNNSL